MKLIKLNKDEIEAKLGQMEETYRREALCFKEDGAKRGEEFDQEVQRLERELGKFRLHNDQAMDFLLLIKKELIKVGDNFEKKINLIKNEAGGLGATIQTSNSINCTLEPGEHNASRVNTTQGDILITTVIEGSKRVLESLGKRIESFVAFSQ
jgi:hypothetical protein